MIMCTGSAGAAPPDEALDDELIVPNSLPQQPRGSSGGGDAVAPSGETESTGWGIPPVRWGGSLVTEYRVEKYGNEPRRTQQIEIANIKAGSYIWQPWFAQVSGGLGLIYDREHISGGGTRFPVLNQARDTSSTDVYGNAELSLFPISRFPFNAYFDLSDSRATGELTGSDTTNTRFGMRQSYRPPEGQANYAASYDHSTLKSRAFGRDTVNAYAASLNRSVGAHAFDATGNHTRNSRSNTSERTALTDVTARHSYRPEPELTVESLASASSSDFHLLSGRVPSDSRSQFAQANTFVTWRPEEDSPLYVTGGGRMFRSVISNNAGQVDLLTLSGNVGATYALGPRTTLSGGLTVTDLMSDAANLLLTTQTAAATHVGEPLRFYDFAYTWNVGANVANQTGLPEGARQNVGGQLGHSLNRSVMLGQGAQLNIGLGQSFGSTYDTVIDSSNTLSHNANVSWRMSRGPATSAYLSFLAADARTTGYYANHFQMLNLQATGQLQFNRSSWASLNLTLQGTRQRTDVNPDAGFDFTAGGNATYYHNRAFNVPRLRYSALYSINETQFRSRLQGDVTAPREYVEQSFEQRFDYNIGRVAMRLSMRIAEISGRRDTEVFFRIARPFGLF